MSWLRRLIDRAFTSSPFMLGWCLFWAGYQVVVWHGWFSVLAVAANVALAAAFAWLWWARRRLRRRP